MQAVSNARKVPSEPIWEAYCNRVRTFLENNTEPNLELSIHNVEHIETMSHTTFDTLHHYPTPNTTFFTAALIPNPASHRQSIHAAIHTLAIHIFLRNRP